MKPFLIWTLFTAAIVSAPLLTDKLVDAQFAPAGSNFTPEEQAAHAELVVRAGKEADARKKKPSLSEQAMIVRDLYGN